MQHQKLFALIAGILIFAAAGFYIDMRMQSADLHLPQPNAAPAQNATSSLETNLLNYGPAPEFAGIDTWLNSNPLTMQNLRGKTVLVDFWTYSCINCIRTLPYVTRWYDTYKDKGFVVIGVHTPEFAFEKDSNNVQAAISHFNIHYPVAQDNEYATWNAYGNHYWPAEYLIDKNGSIVHVHFGEGEYDVTENTIRALLGLQTMTMGTTAPNLTGIGSPEMYFGTARLQNLTPEQTPSSSPKTYAFPSASALNNFALEGTWQFNPDTMSLVNGPGKIRLTFHAGKIHLVASSKTPATVTITVDGKRQPSVTVADPKLYTLFDSNDYADHVIEISIDQPGFEAFTFTFG